MTEDVRPEVIKKTQDILGKYFKKPPLTEKLLKKPPFRFLHDIVSAIIRETGFLDGLFSEFELNSENIKDKDSKLAYLTKLIDVVKLITASNLNVRASKIIAGHEPTKTNELLQAIGKALDKKVSSVEAIEHYKSSNGSKSKSLTKTKLAAAATATAAKDEIKKPNSRQSSQSRKSFDKDKPPVDRNKKSTVTSKAAPSKETKTRSEEKRDKNREREKENKTKVGRVERDDKIVEIPPAEPIEEKKASSARRQKHSTSLQSKEEPSPLSPKRSASQNTKPALSDSTNSPTHKVKDSSTADITKSPSIRETKSDSKPPAEAKRKSSSAAEKDDGTVKSGKNAHSESRSKKSGEKNEQPKVPEEARADFLSPSLDTPKSESVNNKLEKQHNFENPGSPPPKSGIDNFFIDQTEGNTITVPESSAPVRPRTSLRPPSARPMSARPAAPRIRSKPEYTFNEDITTPMGTVNVIVENFDTKEEDDVDDMVVMETGGNGDSLGIDGSGRTESQLSEEHGHLVAQILETQRELINTDNVDVMPKKVEIEWEAGSRRDRETTIKEVDKLRTSIQTLTRATNPLGKLLDYLQEDVEMMQRELHEWRSQYDRLSEQLQREQMLTQESVEPMKVTLKDIEGNIEIELDKICQIKAGIMKNDQKIQRLLNGHA